MCTPLPAYKLHHHYLFMYCITVAFLYIASPLPVRTWIKRKWCDFWGVSGVLLGSMLIVCFHPTDHKEEGNTTLLCVFGVMF